MLEDETIDIIGATGTSAGAMNAIVLADGMVKEPKKHASGALAGLGGDRRNRRSIASSLGPCRARVPLTRL